MLWQRDWGFILRIRPFRGLAILLAITAPWFIAVSWPTPSSPTSSSSTSISSAS
jgi:4-amino-4-deoxy-L-arabinose transferase-like glycosyltransferase